MGPLWPSWVAGLRFSCLRPREAPVTSQDRGRLRASHADREQVIEVLKAAFVQGRLAKDEFDARVGQAFTARTYAQLAAVTADLPAGLVTARPGEAARVQRSVVAIISVITVLTA